MTRIIAIALAFGAILAVGGGVRAESFPERPITLVVPFAPGGLTDAAGRLMANQMSEYLGQPVIVENRAGGGGYIGTDYVAKAAPDGYTMVYALMGTMAASVSLSPDLPYKPLEDFRSVSKMFQAPNLLVATKDAPFGTMQELIDYATENPEEVSFASTGVGTASHLAAALFMSITGIEMNHIPYQGSAPAMTDLVAGRVDVMFDYPITSTPHVNSGDLQALVYFGQERPASLPEVPTLGELGFPPDAMSPSWNALMVPAGTPDAVVERLIEAAEHAMDSEPVKAHMVRNSDQRLVMNGDEMHAFVAAQTEFWGQVIREASITLGN